MPAGGRLPGRRSSSSSDSHRALGVPRTRAGRTGPAGCRQGSTCRDLPATTPERVWRCRMKIVVVGGSGLIGSKVVTMLRRDGHDVVAASRRSGVDIVSGEG